jgi:hypothetical protein
VPHGDGDWIGIEPAADDHPAWGLSDRLWLLDSQEAWAPREALTLFQAVDYARPDMIPPLFAPARLPPGAGTAVLNLIAGLMKDQGVARVRYRGPYPTEQLFTALLECFRHDPALDDALRRFMDADDVDWIPAPHERHLVAPGVSVQLRHQIDKVVLDGVAFYRRDWQGVIRHEPRVVREEGARVICSLWALGRSLEDRLTLDRSGEVQERPAPALDPIPPAPLPPVWAPALAELIARESAPALASSLREVMRALTLEWGAVPGDLLEVDGARVRVSRRLRAAGVEWVGESGGRPGASAARDRVRGRGRSPRRAGRAPARPGPARGVERGRAGARARHPAARGSPAGIGGEAARPGGERPRLIGARRVTPRSDQALPVLLHLKRGDGGGAVVLARGLHHVDDRDAGLQVVVPGQRTVGNRDGPRGRRLHTVRQRRDLHGLGIFLAGAAPGVETRKNLK